MIEVNLEEILPEVVAALMIMGAVVSQPCQTAHGVSVATAQHGVFSNAIQLSVV